MLDQDRPNLVDPSDHEVNPHYAINAHNLKNQPHHNDRYYRKNVPNQPHVPDRDVICQYFTISNSCRNGSKCRYKHIPASDFKSFDNETSTTPNCFDVNPETKSRFIKKDEYHGYPNERYPVNRNDNHGYPNERYSVNRNDNHGYPNERYPVNRNNNHGYPNERYPVNRNDKAFHSYPLEVKSKKIPSKSKNSKEDEESNYSVQSSTNDDSNAINSKESASFTSGHGSNSSRVCKFYESRNGCTYGEKCKFVHREIEVSPINSKEISSKSRNSKGDGKTFQHSQLDEQSKHFVQSSTDDDSNVIRHEGSASFTSGQGPNSNRVCKFYESRSGCTYGEKCKFLHREIEVSPINSNEIPSKSRNIKGDGKNSQRYQINEQSNHFVQSSTGDDSNVIRCEESSSFTAGQDPNSSRVCKFYVSSYGCTYGENCKFLHKENDVSPVESKRMPSKSKNIKKDKESSQHSQLDKESNHFFQTSIDEDLNVIISEDSVSSTSKQGTNSRRICKKFESSDGCTYGDNCKFLHRKIDVSHVKKSPLKTQRFAPLKVFDLNELTAETLMQIRQKDIDFFKKRFPAFVTISSNGIDNHFIEFKPSDPDWPFDVTELYLNVTFLPEYPKEMLKVDLDEIKNDRLPEPVRQSIEKRIHLWINERFNIQKMSEKVELVFAFFMKWLDKTADELFTKALTAYKHDLQAEAAGIQFIPALKTTKKTCEKDDNLDEPSKDLVSRPDDISSKETLMDHNIETENSDSDNLVMQNDTEDGDNVLEKTFECGDVFLKIAGTEVKFCNLNLIENIGTLTMERYKLIVQCNRCKHKNDLPKLSPSVTTSASCSQCFERFTITFRKAIMHTMNSVAGYLDLDSCQAFDIALIDCVFMVDCLDCSKQLKVEGLDRGVIKEMGCFACHKKMKLSLDSVRFHIHNVENEVSNKIQVNLITSKKRIPKDPAIKDGEPLPNTGSCKHYKKSYRWLRFPCCGKAFPCDVCHDETEIDHEMKFANRMICGYCAKEQPYASDKDCIRCGKGLTRQSSVYWEGGQGCRDKTKMSRNDDKKFSNLNKTISRKASEKKNTK